MRDAPVRAGCFAGAPRSPALSARWGGAASPIPRHVQTERTHPASTRGSGARHARRGRTQQRGSPFHTGVATIAAPFTAAWRVCGTATMLRARRTHGPASTCGPWARAPALTPRPAMARTQQRGLLSHKRALARVLSWTPAWRVWTAQGTAGTRPRRAQPPTPPPPFHSRPTASSALLTTDGASAGFFCTSASAAHAALLLCDSATHRTLWVTTGNQNGTASLRIQLTGGHHAAYTCLIPLTRRHTHTWSKQHA